MYALSIIVQGNVSEKLTSRCLKSIRKNFPDCELILSTWEGSDIADLPVDKLVFSPDPGAVYCDEVVGTLNNVNRQLVSTKAGLAVATRPYILKTRTDILFENADFLNYFGKYDGAPSAYFKNRLLICNYYTRNPRVFDTCFHPSDWIVFGRAEDVRTYYENTPLMTAEEGDWFRIHDKKSTFFTNYVCRFTPEQHIFLGFLRQWETVNCQCYYDHSRDLVKQTEHAFADCFVVLDYQKQLEITFPKYDPNRYLEKHTLISHWKWKALYDHYSQKKASLLWASYLMYGATSRTFSTMRTILVRLLDRMGIKESVKRFLRKGSGGADSKSDLLR